MDQNYSTHCLTLLSKIQLGIKKCFRNDDDFTFTVLMHVPLKKLGAAMREAENFGYLVDVSDSSNYVDGVFAAQCPLSGESGRLFHSPPFDRLREVKISPITPKIQMQYWNANKDIRPQSNLLVEREGLRYKFGEDKKPGVPPEGRHICQVALSPDRRTCVFVHTNPVLGVVYKIIDNEHLSSVGRDKLVKIAIDAGEIAFDNLIQTFYGSKYKSVFAEFFHASQTTHDLHVIHSVIATFLLSHHWFYAFKPTALKAFLLLSGGDRNAVSGIYTRSHFQFPECSTERCPDGMTQIIESLSNDLMALLLCGYWDDGINEWELFERKITLIRKEMWRVLVALTGTPIALDDAFVPITDDFSHGSYFTIGLPNGLARVMDEECLVPYFTAEQMENVADSVRAEMMTFYLSFAPREFSKDSFYFQLEGEESGWTFKGTKLYPKGSLSPHTQAWSNGKYHAHTHSKAGKELKKYWKSMRWVKICAIYNILSAMPKEKANAGGV